MDAVEILFDGNRGVYIPQNFVEECDLSKFKGVPADITPLQAGPEHEWYWEAWEEILNSVTYVDADGSEYMLYQDGDLFLICDAKMTAEEYEEFWGEPRDD